MQVEHVIVSSEELTRLETIGDPPYPFFDKESTPVPKWAMIACFPVVAILPLLCVLVAVLRISLRRRPLAHKYAWLNFLSTLLLVSATLTSLAAAVYYSLPRMPVVLGTNIPDFDERDSYPRLPFWTDLESAEVSIELKPLVIIVSPMQRMWPTHPAATFGAGVLLMANEQGYLFATAKHVVANGEAMPGQALVSTVVGMRASADVIATAEQADLALLWVNRRTGHAMFAQPIKKASDGDAIFVIGHPEGLNYTLSTGIVSGLRGNDVQISAAISPGNSGGPVYDLHGNLEGIVNSKFDRNRDANAENLGFATTAEVLQEITGWQFEGDGKLRLQEYIQALNNR